MCSRVCSHSHSTRRISVVITTQQRQVESVFIIDNVWDEMAILNRDSPCSVNKMDKKKSTDGFRFYVAGGLFTVPATNAQK